MYAIKREMRICLSTKFEETLNPTFTSSMSSVWYLFFCHRNIHLIPSLLLCSIIWAPTLPLSLSLSLNCLFTAVLRLPCCGRAFSIVNGEQGLFPSCGEGASP